MINGDILDVEVMARKENWNDGISLYMRQRTVGRGSVIAKPIKFEEFKSGSIATPMVTLEIQQCQQLMDELWNCGLRPTEGTGSAGSLAATERHLKDLQRIVFKGKP